MRLTLPQCLHRPRCRSLWTQWCFNGAFWPQNRHICSRLEATVHTDMAQTVVPWILVLAHLGNANIYHAYASNFNWMEPLTVLLLWCICVVYAHWFLGISSSSSSSPCILYLCVTIKLCTFVNLDQQPMETTVQWDHFAKSLRHKCILYFYSFSLEDEIWWH